MAREYLILIESIYLTRDGQVGGIRCKNTVEGLPARKLTKTVKIDKDADGNAYAITRPLPSVPITIRTEGMLLAVFDDLVDVFQTALNDETLLSVAITGDTGAFAFDALPKSIGFGKFSNGRIYGIVIDVETT